MRSAIVVVLAAMAAAAAVPASAQTAVRSAAQVSTPGSRIGGSAYGIFEGESMAAKDSFAAVLTSGESTITFAGVGGEVTNLWKGLFARVGVTHSSNKASRVFVDASGNAHPLNIPMTIKITPIEIGGGWRFNTDQGRRRVAVVPYVGAAVLIQRYKETSSFAEPDENVDASDTGQAYFGGVEVGFGVVRIGVEGKYRNVPDVLGADGSVSAAFDETNLGGAVFRLSFGVGF